MVKFVNLHTGNIRTRIPHVSSHVRNVHTTRLMYDLGQNNKPELKRDLKLIVDHMSLLGYVAGFHLEDPIFDCKRKKEIYTLQIFLRKGYTNSRIREKGNFDFTTITPNCKTKGKYVMTEVDDDDNTILVPLYPRRSYTTKIIISKSNVNRFKQMTSRMSQYTGRFVKYECIDKNVNKAFVKPNSREYKLTFGVKLYQP